MRDPRLISRIRTQSEASIIHLGRFRGRILPRFADSIFHEVYCSPATGVVTQKLNSFTVYCVELRILWLRRSVDDSSDRVGCAGQIFEYFSKNFLRQVLLATGFA